jgi:ribosome-binding factor A
MAKYRGGRINEEMKKGISVIIQSKIKDPRLSGLISVTKVDVTRDLSHAKVFVSVFGSEEEKKMSFQILNTSAGFIRSELSKSMKMRHIPQILIQEDEGMQHGMNIEDILKKIKDKEKSDN